MTYEWVENHQKDDGNFFFNFLSIYKIFCKGFDMTKIKSKLVGVGVSVAGEWIRNKLGSSLLGYSETYEISIKNTCVLNRPSY